MTAEPVPNSPADSGQVTILLDRKKVSVSRVANETLLESARRAGLSPPFSCEAGNCGTCMGRLVEGKATMRINDALDEDEVEDGGADEKDGLLKDSNRPQRKSKRRHPIVVALNRHLDLLKTVCPFIHKRRYINVIVERETIVFDTELMAFSA